MKKNNNNNNIRSQWTLCRTRYIPYRSHLERETEDLREIRNENYGVSGRYYGVVGSIRREIGQCELIELDIDGVYKLGEIRDK